MGRARKMVAKKSVRKTQSAKTVVVTPKTKSSSVVDRKMRVAAIILLIVVVLFWLLSKTMVMNRSVRQNSLPQQMTGQQGGVMQNNRGSF